MYFNYFVVYLSPYCIMNELFDQIKLLEELAEVSKDHYLQYRVEKLKDEAIKLLEVQAYITIRPN